MGLPVPFGNTDLGKFAEPVTAFINRISEAIGSVYEPTKIKRRAKAEREARLLGVKTDVEVARILSSKRFLDAKMDMRVAQMQRAEQRRLLEKLKDQENIESIVRKALPYIAEDANSEMMNDDWIRHFFDNARMYSDQEIQSLWARILAGEANAPGTFSRGTVSLLSTIDKRDAELFAKVRRFCMNMESVFVPLIYKPSDPIYQTNGVNSEMLIRLEETGLVRFEPMYSTEYEVRTIAHLKQRRFLEYFDERIWFRQGDKGGDAVATGAVTLTQAGRELAPICDVKPIAGFVEYLKALWKSWGMEIEDAVAS